MAIYPQFEIIDPGANMEAAAAFCRIKDRTEEDWKYGSKWEGMFFAQQSDLETVSCQFLGLLLHYHGVFLIYLHLESLQLFHSANSLTEGSFPHIFFPAFLGCFRKCSFLS